MMIDVIVIIIGWGLFLAKSQNIFYLDSIHEMRIQSATQAYLYVALAFTVLISATGMFWATAQVIICYSGRDHDLIRCHYCAAYVSDKIIVVIMMVTMLMMMNMMVMIIIMMIMMMMMMIMIRLEKESPVRFEAIYSKLC